MTDPDHLARLHIDGHAPVDQASALHLRTIPLRHPDRRPPRGAPVGPRPLEAIAAAVAVEPRGYT